MDNKTTMGNEMGRMLPVTAKPPPVPNPKPKIKPCQQCGDSCLGTTPEKKEEKCEFCHVLETTCPRKQPNAWAAPFQNLFTLVQWMKSQHQCVACHQPVLSYVALLENMAPWTLLFRLFVPAQWRKQKWKCMAPMRWKNESIATFAQLLLPNVGFRLVCCQCVSSPQNVASSSYFSKTKSATIFERRQQVFVSRFAIDSDKFPLENLAIKQKTTKKKTGGGKILTDEKNTEMLNFDDYIWVRIPSFFQSSPSLHNTANT